jgi:hypothetical protein
VHGVGRFEKPKEEVPIVPKGVFTEDKLCFRSVEWTKSLVRFSPLSEESEASILDCFLRELRVDFAARISTNLKVDTKVGRGTIVVFLGLDNGIFYEADEMGSAHWKSKDKEGKYHLVGKVEVAGARQQGNLMENCVQIW